LDVLQTQRAPGEALAAVYERVVPGSPNPSTSDPLAEALGDAFTMGYAAVAVTATGA
jgi:hypothetical protein